ncbi:molybdate ABC transporter substrate-binding protein [Salinisphaera sp. T31B1]|uniref:molybdate ABC transporter substrate-binding protein n=1 Tax=Salinisphaera sp. T31B1 TaxID=727963 RepID=UPI00333E1F18
MLNRSVGGLGSRAVLLTLCLLAMFYRPAYAADDSLLVFAAASLKNAMDDVATAFEETHGGDIRISYAGSSTLARQIERAAPADIYVSANQDWMDRVETDEFIDNHSRIDLLANALVLVAPRNRDTRLKIAQGFPIVSALGDRYLAMANTEAVPAGLYGRQAFEHLHVWEALQGHIAQADDVRAALALVARGESPLGVVYASDAVAEPHVRVVDTFPADSHDPIVYPAAILKHVDKPLADAFMSFLQGSRATAIFKRWGFARAAAPARRR